MQSQAETEPPVQEAEQWAKRVKGFLGQKIDSSYVARFESHSDLPPIGPSKSKSKLHENLWMNINYRLMRLEQFLKEYAA